MRQLYFVSMHKTTTNMNKELTILKRFDIPRDADASLKGFFYQFLKTLDSWLINYNNDLDITIHCETEDDIKETLSDNLVFTQVKAYKDNFNINSEEIVKSVFNFFSLYNKYRDEKTKFVFFTNSGFEGEFFERTTDGSILLNPLEKQKSILEIKKLLKKSYREIIQQEIADNEKQIKRLEKERSEKKRSAAIERRNVQISDLEKSIQAHKNEIDKINDFIDREASSFFDRIEWKFEDIDKDKAIGRLNDSIKNNIAKISSFRDKERFVYGRLFEIVANKSQHRNIPNRMLNSDLLESIIKEAETDTEFLKMKFSQEIDCHLDEMFQKLETIEITTKSTEQKVSKIETGLNKGLKIIEQLVAKKDQNDPVLRLTEEVNNWLSVLGYSFEGEPKINKEYSELILNIPRRRQGYDRILISCMADVIELNHLNTLKEKVETNNYDEGWLITYRRISKSVKSKAGKSSYENLFAYTLDELIDEETDFSGYFNWLEEEVAEKQINKFYIPLNCKKELFEDQTNVKLDKNEYEIAEYIDQWIDDPVKKHISILGEFGTGKTWFTLHFAWEKLQEYKKAKIKGLNRPRIPIVIPLRDFSKAVNIEGVFSEFFFKKHNSPIPNYNAFVELNKMGKLLLIFDGFDEMADRIDNQKMINNFWELARTLECNSKVILTSRTEHFPNSQKSRSLLNAELEASIQHIVAETPQFEVLELVKFNEQQIKKLLRLHTNTKTLNKIISNKSLLDLASRPLMTSLIIEGLGEIEEGKPIDTARVYLYALKKKLTKDITEKRTFTSIPDKLFFMCELSWEMLSSENMCINYRLFPDRIRNLFNESVKEEKDIDHWQYDMMGQTILIRNDDGDYKPAHRSYLEFFVAYKFASELGLLKRDFVELAKHANSTSAEDFIWKEYFKKSSNKNVNVFLRSSLEELVETLGFMPLSKTITDFLISMISVEDIATQEVLCEILEQSKNKQDVGFLSNNIVTILASHEYDFFKNKDFSNINLKDFSVHERDFKSKEINQANNELSVCFEGANFTNANLTNADFGNSYPITSGKFINFENTLFINSKLDGFKFHDIQIDSIDINESNNIIAIGSLVGSIVLLDLDTFKVVNRNYTVCPKLKFSNDNEKLFVSSIWKLHVLDPKNLNKLGTVKAEEGSGISGQICLTSNNSKIIVVRGKNFDFVDTDSLTTIKSMQFSNHIDEVYLSKDERYIAINGYETCEVRDLLEDQSVLEYDLTVADKSLIRHIRFFNRENVLVVTGGVRIEFLDLVSKQTIWEIEAEDFEGIEFHNNGNIFVVASEGHFIIYNYIKKGVIKKINFQEYIDDDEMKYSRSLLSFKFDDRCENIYFNSRRKVYCLNIETGLITNEYKHIWSFKNADFSGAKGLDEKTAIQLQKNGATINIDEYK